MKTEKQLTHRLTIHSLTNSSGHTTSSMRSMRSMAINNILESAQPFLCDVCQTISFDRFIEEQTIKHRSFKELHSKSSHCVLCRLIFQTMKQRIIECSVPEVEVEKHIAALGPSQISLRLLLLEESDRLNIAVGPPSIVIDGWHPFLESANSLRLFRPHGEPDHACFISAH